MFDNLKKLQQLKEIKDSLEKEKIEIEREGVKVIINGKMEAEEIKLNPLLEQNRQEEALKKCFNEAVKKIQMMAAEKMMRMH